MELNLLEKTTFWIEDIDLVGTDLGRLAEAAGGALGFAAGEVMVVDVRTGLVAFDVLRPRVEAESIVATEAAVLQAVAAVQGVRLGPGAAVHSEGVLGFIALDRARAEETLEATRVMTEEVQRSIARRAIVFASGPEVRDGRIRDTNSPLLAERLTRHGFRVDFGGVLEDDRAAVEAVLESAVSRAYGLVVTTGGVGAEDKDHNVEAMLRLDPGAHTPWILRFEPDMRRHHKEGVRIAVARVGPTLLVALPGPNDEVRIATDALIEGITAGVGDGVLAERLASVLRSRWQERMQRHGGSHGPGSHL